MLWGAIKHESLPILLEFPLPSHFLMKICFFLGIANAITKVLHRKNRRRIRLIDHGLKQIKTAFRTTFTVWRIRHVGPRYMCWIHKLMHKYLSPPVFSTSMYMIKNWWFTVECWIEAKVQCLFCFGAEWVGGELLKYNKTNSWIYNVTYTARQNQLQALWIQGRVNTSTEISSPVQVFHYAFQFD